MSAADKILHSEGGGGGHRITELPLSMYRISSKLTLTNYTQDQAGVYTYDKLHFLITDQCKIIWFFDPLMYRPLLALNSVNVLFRCRGTNSLGKAESSTRIYTTSQFPT